jgi:hypothetical protein
VPGFGVQEGLLSTGGKAKQDEKYAKFVHFSLSAVPGFSFRQGAGHEDAVDNRPVSVYPKYIILETAWP